MLAAKTTHPGLGVPGAPRHPPGVAAALSAVQLAQTIPDLHETTDQRRSAAFRFSQAIGQ